MIQSLPTEAINVLHALYEPDSGVELFRALEKLIQIFGPPTKELCRKLIDVLVIDSSGW